MRAEQSNKIVCIVRDSEEAESVMGCFDFIKASSVRRRDVK